MHRGNPEVLRVAGAQIEVTKDVSRNVEILMRAIDWAREQEADILLTPEGSLSGYTHTFDSQRVSEALKEVERRARAARVGLALGTCFVEEDGFCYNEVRFYDREGVFLGFHSKTLRCGSMEDDPQGEIQHYAVRPLRTFQIHGVLVGALICNDLWANPGCTPMPDPHLTHQLSLMGVCVIFHAVNGGRNGSDWSKEVAWRFHEANLRMRAQSGKVWIVTVDNCAPIQIPCSAPSGVITPHGHWAVQAPNQGESFFVHDIPLDD